MEAYGQRKSPARLALMLGLGTTLRFAATLAGIPGLEYTRSLNRNGFAQITAIFSDSTDIYFARQQVTERLRMAEDRLPEGVRPEMGPIATGLGDIFMWTVEFRHTHQRSGEPGLQSDGSYITPEGERLVSETDKATYLRTVQQWIVAPAIARHAHGVAHYVEPLEGEAL